MTIELRLSAIYDAAHVSIPSQAGTLSGHGQVVSETSAALGAEVGKVGHPVAEDFAVLGEEILVRLRQIVGTMNDCSTALDRIADRFSRDDEQAQAWFRSHGSWLDRHDYTGAPEQAPVPTLPEER